MEMFTATMICLSSQNGGRRQPKLHRTKRRTEVTMMVYAENAIFNCVAINVQYLGKK